MQRVTVQELLDDHQQVQLMMVQSFEPSLYIVVLEIDGQPYRVADSRGDLVFRSVTAAKQALAGVNVDCAVMEHVSTYDEMIGHAHEPQRSMLRVSISKPEVI